MMKTRIAILQNGLIRGGTERFVINLCKGLDKEKFDISVINPSLRPEEQILEPELVAAGAQVLHTTTIVGLRGRIKHLFLLYRILRNGHYDVFHTNLDLFNGCNLFVAWLAHVPVRICHAHASMQETEIRRGRNMAIRAYQRIMRLLCWHCANRHIGCSDEANEFLYKGYNWRETTYPNVIVNGIDLDRFTTAQDTDYCFKPELNYILAVGRFVPQKNLSFILDTMEVLDKQECNIKLLWVGRGELYQEVEKEILDRKLSNIELLGWRDDIPALMQRSKLLLMPSLFEGLSITLVEAQAARLPCLVSDTITRQAQCGLIKYKSLSDGAQSWAETIMGMLAPDVPRPILDTQTLNRFTILGMAATMCRVIQIG